MSEIVTWEKVITITVDVDKRVEPLVSVDTVGTAKATKMHPLLQGAVQPIVVRFVAIGENGVVSYGASDAGDTLTLVGKRRNLNGDPLFSVTDFTVSPSEESDVSEQWEGTLSLHTIDLDDAMGTYPAIQSKIELLLSNSSGALKQYWQFDADVMRQVCAGEPPVVPGGPTYYTTTQADARFARKDGPTGYATKLVEVDGLLYWAQLVGTKWVVSKIIDVGGVYTHTYVEVGEES